MHERRPSSILSFMMFWSFLLVPVAMSAQTATIQFADDAGQPADSFQEFQYVQVRATDAARAGQWSIPARVTSDLRGDEELINLSEQGSSTGIFVGWVLVRGTLSSAPPVANDSFLEVTEIAGSPLLRDTIRAELVDCSAAPCPTDTAAMTGAILRITDGQWADLDLISPPETIHLEARDLSVPYYLPITATVTSGGDAETVTLDPAWEDPSTPQLGRFRGGVPVEVGAAVPGDGYLQVAASDVVTASRPDPLGLSSAVDTATVGGGLLAFLDRTGQPVDYVLLTGDVRVRALFPAGNWNPSGADSISVEILSRDSSGNVRDRETLSLVETGIDTSVFVGQMPSEPSGAISFNDGVLETGPPYGTLDTIEATLDSATATATLRGGILRFVDSSGADLTQVPANGAVYLRLESDYGNLSSTGLDQAWVHVLSLSTGDDESFPLYETGSDTATFGGSIPGSIGVAAAFDGVLQTQLGETIRGEYYSAAYQLVFDEAVVGEGSSTNSPPVVYGDYATTDEDAVVTINPLANDSDPEGQALSLDAVFPSSLGTAVITDAAAGTVLYTPNPNATGTDTFVYQVRDSQGATSMGFVDVTIRPVNDPPVAVNDTVTTAEDTLVSVFPLANDSDPDGDTIWISAPWPVAAHGQVGATATMFNYLPAANYNGTDTVTYTINDGNGRTATATVTITITPVPDPPVAATDNVTTAEDTVLVVSPLANDSDPDGDAFSLLSVTTALHGSLAINGNAVTYTPVANYNGTDRFDYTIQDATGRNATARVNITLTAVNDPPDAVNDSVSFNEDSAVTVFVKSNDTDPDGDLTFVQSVTQGAHGAVAMSNGLPFYTPVANYFGSDSFTYTLSDGKGGTDVATVSVTVNNIQDAPVALPDAATTPEDTAVVVSVLANDSDADGNTLTVFAVTAAAHGTVTFTAATVRYVPNANYFGPDAFTYSVNDGTGRSATGVPVSITVTSVNDLPTAGNDSGSLAEDGSATLSVLGNDADPDGGALAIASTTQGANGAVSFTASTVTYTPAANFHGTDSFAYTIGDGQGGSATATVSITVSSVNDVPVAANDSATTDEDAGVTVPVLGNDTDLDGDTLAVTAVTQGAHGSVSFTAGGVTYAPAANYNGGDSFTYTIGDGNGGSATATVSISVAAVNDSPNAGNDSGTVAEDGSVSISVLVNDSDIDGDTLAVTAVTQGIHGSVSFTAGGVTFTPAANYNGPDSFTYTIGDGNGGSATATVSITVSSVNDVPVAANDEATTGEDAGVTVSVLGNDSDLDGDTLAVTAVTQGAHGSVSFTAGGVTYTPVANYNGADSFSYTISDTAGLTATASVSVAITAVNDLPDAVSDAATTNEAGAGVVVTVLANDTDIDGTLTVTTVSTPAHGTATKNADNTVTYVPVASYSGADSFTYTISDGAATDTATVTIQVKDVIGRVAVLGTHSVSILTGADVLSGDVVANQIGTAPFLGATEVSLGGGVTTASGWDVQGNRVTISSGAAIASDVYSNQLTNNGTVTGALYSPLALPIFVTLPTLLASTPGTSDVNVGANGSQTLAPGSYRDLIVGKKGTVTFTGGTYHFRSINLSGSEAKLFFSAPSTVRVQQKVSTSNLAQIRPGTGSTATAATIVFHVAGINGTGGGLGETPKAVEIGVDSTFTANLYAPNGTIWAKDRTLATGAFLGKDVQIGQNVQVTLGSAW